MLIGGGDNRWCFFFQAEDGIRDTSVTGVQTCALPIFIGAVRQRDSIAERDAFTIGIPYPSRFRDGGAVNPVDDCERRQGDGGAAHEEIVRTVPMVA